MLKPGGLVKKIPSTLVGILALARRAHDNYTPPCAHRHKTAVSRSSSPRTIVMNGRVEYPPARFAVRRGVSPPPSPPLRISRRTLSIGLLAHFRLVVASLAICVTASCPVFGQVRSTSKTTPLATSPAESKLVESKPGETLTDSVKLRMQNDLRSRGSDQRLACIKDLARYQDVDAVRLIVQYGLRDRSPQLRDAAFASLAASRGIPSLDSFLTETLRQELRTARRSLPEFTHRLAEAVADRRSLPTTAEITRLALDSDEGVRHLAIDALLWTLDRVATERDGLSVPMLQSLALSPLFDNSSGIRKAVIDALRRIERIEALAVLAQTLARIDGELLAESVEHLERISGEKHGVNSAAWQAWCDSQGPKFRWPANMPQESAASRQGAPVYYYNLPIRAQRIVFALDASKSMGLGGTVSRLAAAQQELVNTLEKLPDGTLFNIVVFQAQVATWQERLHPATPATRSHAAAFVRAQRPHGKTATYEALQTAIQMSPEPEVIYLLSDGLPSAGAITLPDRVLESIRQLNQRRRIRIHTLGTLAGPQDAAFGSFLERLATQNAGEFRRLD